MLNKCSFSLTVGEVLRHYCTMSEHVFFWYTRISFPYEYASAVMISLIFLGVKQRDAIKHIQSKDYKSYFCEKIRQS